jgi:methylenetetrahydrofolate reductase (NADPH)
MIHRADKAAIQRLVEEFSTEVLPREAIPEQAALRQTLLPAGTSIYLTVLPGGTPAQTVSAARQLRREGFNPVPHIAARSLRNERELGDYLARLKDEAAVTQALVIAGDLDRPRGSFHCASELLDTGLFEKFSIRRIGVAGHPEGHPTASPEALRDALRAKMAYAERTGAELYVVTQFCFESEPIVSFAEALWRDGIRLPIHAGLPGVTTVKSLLAYAKACGIGPSVRALTRRGRTLTRVSRFATPATLIGALASERIRHPHSLIKRIHVFPLGAFARTAQWLTAVREGRIAFDAEGCDFSVENAAGIGGDP